MKFNDILRSGLIKDTDRIKITIHKDDSIIKSIIKESWTGEWYSDRILEHSDLEVIQILYDPDHGWQIYLRR